MGMRSQSTCAALAVLGAAALLSCFFCVFLLRRPLSQWPFSREPRQQHEQPMSLHQELPGGETGSRPGKHHDGAVQDAATLLTEVTPLTSAGLEVFEPQFEGGTLQKRAYSSKMRLVFLVGLEGTGHHYIADVLDKLCKKELGPCPKMCILADVLYPSMANAKNVSAYKASREKLREEMQTLARFPEGLPEGKAIMASFGACRFKAGMMSYPNFNGPDKTLQYVDFKVVAEEAERAGIDLRIIYLTRQARSILTSDTQHHNYGDTVMKEARVLIANAAVVDSTLQELEPGFTTCLRYENITNPAQALRVAQFVAPTNESAQLLSKTMLGTVKDMSHAPARRHYVAKPRERQRPIRGGVLRPNHGAVRRAEVRPPTEDVSREAEAVVVERLQQKLDKIERDQCAGSGIR